MRQTGVWLIFNKRDDSKIQMCRRLIWIGRKNGLELCFGRLVIARSQRSLTFLEGWSTSDLEGSGGCRDATATSTTNEFTR